MSIFEIIMLICFGASWPFALIKTYKSKSAEGKSLFFLVLVFLGYVAGTLHKVFYQPDLVILLYLLNGIFVLADLSLYFKYKSQVN